MKTLIRIAAICLLLMVCANVHAQPRGVKALERVLRAPKVSVRPPKPIIPVVPPSPHVLNQGGLRMNAWGVPPFMPDSAHLVGPHRTFVSRNEAGVSFFNQADSAKHTAIEKCKMQLEELLQRRNTVKVTSPSEIGDSVVIYNPLE